MAKSSLTETEQVTSHIELLDAAIIPIVEAIRHILLSAHKDIAERIKWNNPSFYFTGEMADFDPKEYKRDIAVFNLHKNRIMLVFPSGAKLKDTSGLLSGDYKDGRRIAIFTNLEEVQHHEKTLKQLLLRWVELVDK